MTSETSGLFFNIKCFNHGVHGGHEGFIKAVQEWFFSLHVLHDLHGGFFLNIKKFNHGAHGVHEDNPPN
jgi:hypothetical protein